MGNNGKPIMMDEVLIKADAPALPNMDKKGMERFALGLVPFTPVPFAGQDMFLAIGRIAGYSLLAYWTYNKMRPASYAFMGAAGLSLATSITAGLWGKK